MNPLLLVPYFILLPTFALNFQGWTNFFWYTRFQLELFTFKEYVSLLKDKDLNYKRKEFTGSEKWSNLISFYISGFFCGRNVRSELTSPVALGKAYSGNGSERDLETN